MIVKRIVTNIAAKDILGLEIAMDLGWIVTFAASTKVAPQLSVAADGGSGTAVPTISLEVDDLDEALRRVRAAGLSIEYGPTDEDWGVRRFYVPRSVWAAGQYTGSSLTIGLPAELVIETVTIRLFTFRRRRRQDC
jgi:lactoylglutathione lyase